MEPTGSITVKSAHDAQLFFNRERCLHITILHPFLSRRNSLIRILSAIRRGKRGVRLYSQNAGKDRLLPRYVITYMDGIGITGLLLAGLFAAAMSSLDSGINSMVATLVTDWYDGRDLGRGRNRMLTLIFGIVVTGIGCIMSFSELPVFDLLLSVGGATLGLLLSILLVGLLFRKATTIGVSPGMVTGLIVYCYIRIYIGKIASEETISSFKPHSVKYEITPGGMVCLPPARQSLSLSL